MGRNIPINRVRKINSMLSAKSIKNEYAYTDKISLIFKKYSQEGTFQKDASSVQPYTKNTAVA
jgi:hypothetical protein